MAFLRIVLFASFVGVALAGEWDCSTTSGTFTRSTDCVVSSQIVVTGKLNVTGIPNANGVLPKIIGGGSNRLFKVESGGELVVKYLNLTGGKVDEDNGAGIYITGTSAKLTVANSIFAGNVATGSQYSYGRGGAIHAAAGCIVNVTSSTIISNSARYGGGLSADGTGTKVVFSDIFVEKNNGDENPR